MATGTTLSLALGIPLAFVFIVCVVKQVTLPGSVVIFCHLLINRVRKLRAVRAQWSTVGIDDWEIRESDVKVATDQHGQDIVLGRGTFGVVLQGIKGDVQPMAIKTMARTGDRTSEEAFVREIAMLKYLSRDRNIVQFYGACVQSSSMLLVAELMEGGDLRTALNNDTTGRFSWWQQGKGVAIDVARGLAFLHSCGVIHRDIKSRNVLLTQSGLAKIADVGLAKLTPDPGAEWQPHRDEAFGTLSWAAPEVLMGERATEKVDIYALGVVLWEICTGIMPKRGGIRDVKPQEAPPEVAMLITACMQREPLRRPSAREVCRVLYKAAPVWQEPPDARDLLYTPSPDITEDRDLLPQVASSGANSHAAARSNADRLRTDRLAAEKPQLQGLIQGIRARLDATRSPDGSGGAKATPVTTSSNSGGTQCSPAGTSATQEEALPKLGRWAQFRMWLSMPFWRRGHDRPNRLDNGSQVDGSVGDERSSDWDAMPTVRRANVATQLAARPAAAADSSDAGSADADGANAEAAADAAENGRAADL